jgi:hypothetical protein
MPTSCAAGATTIRWHRRRHSFWASRRLALSPLWVTASPRSLLGPRCSRRRGRRICLEQCCTGRHGHPASRRLRRHASLSPGGPRDDRRDCPAQIRAVGPGAGPSSSRAQPEVSARSSSNWPNSPARARSSPRRARRKSAPSPRKSAPMRVSATRHPTGPKGEGPLRRLRRRSDHGNGRRRQRQPGPRPAGALRPHGLPRPIQRQICPDRRLAADDPESHRDGTVHRRIRRQGSIRWQDCKRPLAEDVWPATSFLRNTTDPVAAAPCSWNKFLARSTPMMPTSRMKGPPLQLVFRHRKPGTSRCRQERAASTPSLPRNSLKLNS